MMVRQVARQFCWLREVHSLVYGRRASGENGCKLTASTRVGSESRLMDYLGSNLDHALVRKERKFPGLPFPAQHLL